MVIEASRNTPNVLACVLVIVAFLSLQDPRERPEEHREEADRCHNRYADERSDFMTALNIWDRVLPGGRRTQQFRVAQAMQQRIHELYPYAPMA
jgi:HrpA-like RNA helicase